MFKGSLVKEYARRFCQEYPSPKIAQRERSFEYTDSGGNKHNLINGEHLCGPWQTWPAQIDDFALDVSDSHGHRVPDYETLKHILFLDKPEVISRSYVSQEEYEDTIEQFFWATRAGIINGKLRRVIKRKIEKKHSDIPPLWRLFFTRTIRKEVLEESLLKNLIANFKSSVPSYWSGVRGYGLG
jgi:hypothetical protein